VAGLFVLATPGVAVASSGLLDDPVEGIKDAVAPVGETVDEVTAPVRDTVSDVTKPARDTVTDVVDGVVEKVVDPVTEVLDDPTQPITDIADPTKPTVLPPVDPRRPTATTNQRTPRPAGRRDTPVTTKAASTRRTPAGAVVRDTAPLPAAPAAQVERVAKAGEPPSSVADAVADAARAFRFPLLLSAAVALFLAVQHRIDRRDPRLRSNPADEELTFA
jgi:hypothetical protein